MSKNKFEETFGMEHESEVKVNTPESEEEMEDFFDEEFEEETKQEDTADEKPATKEEKVGLIKRFQRWFLKKWKLLLGLGVVTVVGGVIFVYWMGKKPIKIGKVDEIADKIKSGGSAADVIDFAEAMEKIATDMKEEPTGIEVGNF